MAEPTEVQQQNQPAATPPVSQPTAQAAPLEQVRVSPAEYAELIKDRTELKLFSQQQAAAAQEAENVRLKSLAEKGQAEAVITLLREQNGKDIRERDERYAKLQDRLIAKGRDAVVANALTGVTFASESAALHARSILSASLTATLDADGEPIVLESATRRNAAEWIKERLASPDMAHFLAPSGRPGTGGNRGPLTPGTQPQEEPTSLGEAMVFAMQGAMKTNNPQGFGLAGRIGRN